MRTKHQLWEDSWQQLPEKKLKAERWKHTPLPKTGDGAEMTESQPQSQKAITAPKKKRIQTKKAKSVAPASEPLDVTLEMTHSESQPSAPERTEPDSSQEQNTVLSGEVTHAEPGLFSKVKGKQSKRWSYQEGR